MSSPANQPVYVHCAGGRHRTGTMTALYRMTYDGWTAAQAYNEMKQYRFEGFPDHPVLRNYVYAYKPLLPKQPAVPATGTSPRSNEDVFNHEGRDEGEGSGASRSSALRGLIYACR